jgi:hypothetical protein
MVLKDEEGFRTYGHMPGRQSDYTRVKVVVL